MLAAKAGINKEELDTKLPRISEIPFSSEAKRMTAVHATPEGLMAYAKGAPEVILKSCTRLLGEHANVPLDSQSRDSI